MQSTWRGGWILAAIAAPIAWFLSHSATVCLLVLACLLLTHIGYGLMRVHENLVRAVEWLAEIQKTLEETRKLFQTVKDR